MKISRIVENDDEYIFRSDDRAEMLWVGKFNQSWWVIAYGNKSTDYDPVYVDIPLGSNYRAFIKWVKAFFRGEETV